MSSPTSSESLPCRACRNQPIFLSPPTLPYDLEEVREDAKTCSDCALLVRAVEFFGSRLLLDTSHPNRRWHIHPEGQHTLSLGYTDEEWQFRCTDMKRELPISFFVSPESSSPFYTLPTPPSLCVDTGSDAAVRKAKGWISSCFDTHEHCPGRQGPVRLPKRTLLILDENRVRLSVNDGGSMGNYACLSHCWGGSQPVVTTSDTVIPFQDEIDYEALPKTFRDAIRFVHKLGIGHLWIDTLCIVQDDRDDWAEQSFDMASIYSNSYVTISATASREGSEGCFRNNTTPTWQTFEVPRSEEGDGTDMPQLVARASLHGHKHPIVDRGWAFQEQVLSRRILHFNEHELAWICSMFPTGGCECGKDELFRQGGLEGSNYDEWIEIVQRFTRRQLTYGSDKLPALSGIAREFQERRERGDPTRISNWVSRDFEVGGDPEPPLGNYLAGIWEGRLSKQLAWHNDITRLGYSPPSAPRADAYRSPTWCWSSIDDRVNINWYDAEGEEYKVLRVECVPTSAHNKFGEVASGFLDLEVPLLHFNVSVDRGGYNGNLQSHVVSQPDAGDYGVLFEHFAIDTPDVFERAESCDDGIQVTCALVGNRNKYSGTTCLVLQAVSGQPGVFSRVGIAKLVFEEYPTIVPATIRIV